MANVAPAACSFWAIPQAIERLLASPKTTAVLPAKLIMLAFFLQGQCTGEHRAHRLLEYQPIGNSQPPRSTSSTLVTGRPRNREPRRSNFSTESVAKKRRSGSVDVGAGGWPRS